MILETERLFLRQMEQSDYLALCKMLQDIDVMYAYEHAFEDAEAREWLDRQRRRYLEDGLGLWAVVLKDTDEMIGQCGLTMQEVNGRQVTEVGYLFRKAYWHKGYAIEAALACKQYAFAVLGLPEVYAIIRDNNLPSQRVAEKLGMSARERLVKHYYGMEMPHLVFSVRNKKAGG